MTTTTKDPQQAAFMRKVIRQYKSIGKFASAVSDHQIIVRDTKDGEPDKTTYIEVHHLGDVDDDSALLNKASLLTAMAEVDNNAAQQSPRPKEQYLICRWARTPLFIASANVPDELAKVVMHRPLSDDINIGYFDDYLTIMGQQ